MPLPGGVPVDAPPTTEQASGNAANSVGAVRVGRARPSSLSQPVIAVMSATQASPAIVLREVLLLAARGIDSNPI
jgi:hypothetical protein